MPAHIDTLDRNPVLYNLERVRAEERLSGSSTESLQRAVLELKEQLSRFEAALESERRQDPAPLRRNQGASES